MEAGEGVGGNKVKQDDSPTGLDFLSGPLVQT